MNTNKEHRYTELRRKHQEEVNVFPMFFAFTEKSFAEGMSKLGLNPDDYSSVCSIGYGGFIRKTDMNAMKEMTARHRRELKEEIARDKTGCGFIYDMFVAEMLNHECGYVMDSSEALDALELTLEEIEANAALKKGYEKALYYVMGD